VPSLDVGDRVTHDAYGMGRVVALEGMGSNAVAKIDFGESGTKRLLLRYSPVTKLYRVDSGPGEFGELGTGAVVGEATAECRARSHPQEQRRQPAGCHERQDAAGDGQGDAGEQAPVAHLPLPLQPLDALVPWRSTPESEREQPGGQQTGEAHGRTEEEPIDRGEAERHSDRDTGDAVEQPLEQARGHRATATVE